MAVVIDTSPMRFVHLLVLIGLQSSLIIASYHYGYMNASSETNDMPVVVSASPKMETITQISVNASTELTKDAPSSVSTQPTTPKQRTESPSVASIPPKAEQQVQTLEERFALAPSDAPLSEFDRKRMQKLPPTVSLKTSKTPIFVASLPRSGTSSVWKYFLCGGHMAAHTYSRVNQTLAYRIGDCIEQNIRLGRKPFQGCGPYYVWSDNGYVFPVKKKRNIAKCFYPSLESLDALYQSYPEMTILLTVRNLTSWTKSVQNFQRLAYKWLDCKEPYMPKRIEDLGSFYQTHAARVRNFAKARPSINYIEVQLEGDQAGVSLEQAFGIPASCWGCHHAAGKSAC